MKSRKFHPCVLAFSIFIESTIVCKDQYNIAPFKSRAPDMILKCFAPVIWELNFCSFLLVTEGLGYSQN